MKGRTKLTKGNHAHPPLHCCCILCLLVLNDAFSFFFHLSVPPEKDDKNVHTFDSRQKALARKPLVPSLPFHDSYHIPSSRRPATTSRNACRQALSVPHSLLPSIPRPCKILLNIRLPCVAHTLLYRSPKSPCALDKGPAPVPSAATGRGSNSRRSSKELRTRP